MRNVIHPSVGFRLVPGNFSPMKGADLHGRATEGGCGHAMEIWLKLEGDRVAGATYVTDGCESFVLCGSLLAHLCQGLTLAEAARLGRAEVLAAVGADDESTRQSADLALGALAAAVASARLQEQP